MNDTRAYIGMENRTSQAMEFIMQGDMEMSGTLGAKGSKEITTSATAIPRDISTHYYDITVGAKGTGFVRVRVTVSNVLSVLGPRIVDYKSEVVFNEVPSWTVNLRKELESPSSAGFLVELLEK